MAKILAVGFKANIKPKLNALKATGWCDTFYLEPNTTAGGAPVPGTIRELKKLGINFKNYNAALFFHEGLSPAQEYCNEQCARHGVTIYGNQHGFNKSILQIVDSTPGIYSKYWNCMGPYFLDRFKEVMGRDAITQRWISIGSLTHDYLHKNYRWSENNNNGKALIIHEPDLKICEGDPHPHCSEEIVEFIIAGLKAQGIEADMKLHPNWKNFIGNTGERLKRPEGVRCVDIELEDIVHYALLVGSRSTMLLDAVAMGIPTLALESSSAWEDDKYPPVEDGLIPTFSRENFAEGLRRHFNVRPEYQASFRDYFLGPLGRVAEDYYKFIQDDLSNPSKILGEYYFRWQEEYRQYRGQKSLAGKLRKLYRRGKEKLFRTKKAS